MIIRIDDIPRDGIGFSVEEPPEEYDLNYDVYKVDTPVKLKMFVYVADGKLIAKGSIGCEVVSECVRCLAPVRMSVNIQDYYGTWDIQDAHTIDLTEQLREDIILNFPVKPLCVDTCKGLCSVCGGNRNKRVCSCAQEAGNNPFDVLNTLK